MPRRKPDDIDRFRAWLAENGAEVLEPTNPYEIVRFRSDIGTAVLYRKTNGAETPTGQMSEALSAFRAGKTMRFGQSTPNRRQGDPVRRAILARDGEGCFYCGEAIPDGEATIEHLVSRTNGGPNHIANKFLACGECNRRAGHLSAPEKIRLRDELRGHGSAAVHTAHAPARPDTETLSHD